MTGRQGEPGSGQIEFGAELRRWRSTRELSLAALSRLVHYSKGYLSKIENGDKPVTPDVARRCDEALDAGGVLVSLVGSVDDRARVRIPTQTSVAHTCPFRGLAAFGPGDARWFFGRERATAELLARFSERLDDPGPVLLVGASGVGKSSLLRAGLVPALDRESRECSVMTPTSDPLGELDRRTPTGTGSVLVVDQFEEVFTSCQDEAIRSRFISAVCAREPVVLAVRADFYGRLLRYPALAGAVRDGQVVLGPLRPDELRAAVVEPARLAGLEVESGLVEVLLRDLGGGHYEPGRLPLLAHALLATWQLRRGNRLTVADYHLAGGVQAAVANTAERAYGHLDTPGKEIARRVLPRLVRVSRDNGPTRGRVGVDQLPVVLDGFVEAHLLTVDEGSVTIAHEALVDAWPRLRGWIETDRATLYARRQLAEQAETWDRHGRLGPPAMDIPLADHSGEPSEVAAAYLRAGERGRGRCGCSCRPAARW